MAETTRLHADARPLVAAGLLIAVIVYLQLNPWDLRGGFFIGAPMGRDFSNFWLAPTLALRGTLTALFDFAAYNEALVATFSHYDDWMVFSYPPTTLLFLLPLALLPYAGAVSIWTAFNLVALGTAARLLGASGWLTLATMLSPAALIAAIYGHFGGALALAGTAALKIAASRPALAGALLALTGTKPQFGLMLGFIFLLAKQWRCVIWACGFGATIVATSLASFDFEAWRGFVGWTLPFHRRLLEEHPDLYFKHCITLFVSGRASDLGLLGIVAQAIFSVFALGCAAAALRRHGSSPRAIAVALLACVLAPTYGSHYDLAIAAPAVAVALLGTSSDPGGAPRPSSLIRLLLWLAPAFAVILGANDIYLAAPVLAVCFLMLAVPLVRGSVTRTRGNALFTLPPLYG